MRPTLTDNDRNIRFGEIDAEFNAKFTHPKKYQKQIMDSKLSSSDKDNVFTHTEIQSLMSVAMQFNDFTNINEFNKHYFNGGILFGSHDIPLFCYTQNIPVSGKDHNNINSNQNTTEIKLCHPLIYDNDSEYLTSVSVYRKGTNKVPRSDKREMCLIIRPGDSYHYYALYIMPDVNKVIYFNSIKDTTKPNSYIKELLKIYCFDESVSNNIKRIEFTQDTDSCGMYVIIFVLYCFLNYKKILITSKNFDINYFDRKLCNDICRKILYDVKYVIGIENSQISNVLNSLNSLNSIKGTLVIYNESKNVIDKKDARSIQKNNFLTFNTHRIDVINYGTMNFASFGFINNTKEQKDFDERCKQLKKILDNTSFINKIIWFYDTKNTFPNYQKMFNSSPNNIAYINQPTAVNSFLKLIRDDYHFIESYVGSTPSSTKYKINNINDIQNLNGNNVINYVSSQFDLTAYVLNKTSEIDSYILLAKPRLTADEEKKYEEEKKNINFVLTASNIMSYATSSISKVFTVPSTPTVASTAASSTTLTIRQRLEKERSSEKYLDDDDFAKQIETELFIESQLSTNYAKELLFNLYDINNKFYDNSGYYNKIIRKILNDEILKKPGDDTLKKIIESSIAFNINPRSDEKGKLVTILMFTYILNLNFKIIISKKNIERLLNQHGVYDDVNKLINLTDVKDIQGYDTAPTGFKNNVKIIFKNLRHNVKKITIIKKDLTDLSLSITTNVNNDVKHIKNSFKNIFDSKNTRLNIVNEKIQKYEKSYTEIEGKIALGTYTTKKALNDAEDKKILIMTKMSKLVNEKNTLTLPGLFSTLIPYQHQIIKNQKKYAIYYKLAKKKIINKELKWQDPFYNTIHNINLTDTSVILDHLCLLNKQLKPLIRDEIKKISMAKSNDTIDYMLKKFNYANKLYQFKKIMTLNIPKEKNSYNINNYIPIYNEIQFVFDIKITHNPLLKKIILNKFDKQHTINNIKRYEFELFYIFLKNIRSLAYYPNNKYVKKIIGTNIYIDRKNNDKLADVLHKFDIYSSRTYYSGTRLRKAYAKYIQDEKNKNEKKKLETKETKKIEDYEKKYSDTEKKNKNDIEIEAINKTLLDVDFELERKKYEEDLEQKYKINDTEESKRIEIFINSQRNKYKNPSRILKREYYIQPPEIFDDIEKQAKKKGQRVENTPPDNPMTISQITFDPNIAINVKQFRKINIKL